MKFFNKTNENYAAWFLVLCVVFLGSGRLYAAVPLNEIHQTHLGQYSAKFDYYEDPHTELSIERVRGLEEEVWIPATDENSSFGFSQSTYWLRLDIVNREKQTLNLILDVAYPLLDSVSFYAFDRLGENRELHTGDNQDFYPRDVDHPNMLFRFQLTPEEKITLYISAKTQGSMILPLSIWRENEFFERAAREQQVHFFYYGTLSVICLINLAVFAALRERLYLFYSLSTLGYLMFFLTSRGHAQQLLFPYSPEISTQIFVSSMPILALFSLLFAREFLKTYKYSPKTDLAIRGMIYFEYFNMVAAIVLDYNTAVKISAVSAVVLFGVLFVAGPVTWWQKRRAGMFFTIAWIPLTVGIAATSGRTSGLLSNNFLTEYAMQIGSGLEAFILTLALADRLYREREKKIQAQAQSLNTEKRRLEAKSQLAEAMMRDPITQLLNRNRFEWMVNQTLEKYPKERFIVGVARVTRLSDITRTLGLTSSEVLISKIAQQMNTEACKLGGVVSVENSDGQKDAAFQLAGDAFGVLIRQSVSEKNQELYLGSLAQLYSPIVQDDLAIELVPQFGSALYPAHGKNAGQLIRNAYVAVEHSNRPNSTVFNFYDPSLDIYNESRLTLMADLRKAIQADALALHYQPKLDLKDEKIVGIEALVRWQHPERGYVSPVDFVPLAEETGVIHDLTQWVFSRAVKDLVKLRSLQYLGNISINISAMDLLDINFTDFIRSTLEPHDIDPSSIILELTETAAMHDPDLGLEALKQINSVGIKISIDDFGTGHSSLSYLKSLPASEIKLDRSLVKDICESESSRVILKTAIDMAHSLGYNLVAEGAEDKETYNMLKEMGCDKLQGYWLCRPLPLTLLIEWLSKSQRKTG